MSGIVLAQSFGSSNFIESTLQSLSRIGFYEFLLPWLFTFAVVYGLLVKADLFGGINKKISGILAIVIAFFVTPYAGPALTSFFATLSVVTSTVIAGIIVIILFGALIGIEGGGQFLGKKKGATWIVIILGVITFVVAAGGRFLGINLSSNLGTIFVILLVIAAIAYITGDSGEKPASTDDKNKGKPPG